MLSVKQKASSTIFWVFGMTWPGIEPFVSWAIGKHSTHEANDDIRHLCYLGLYLYKIYCMYFLDYEKNFNIHLHFIFQI